MSAKKKTVLITRPREQAEEFAAVVKDAGFEVILMPMLDVRPVAFDIPDLSLYDGLIFTSANAVRAFSDVISVRDLPVFCVGEKTKNIAVNYGWEANKNISGNVESLELSMSGLDGRYLYLSGADISRPLRLQKAHIDRLVVYEAIKMAAVDHDVLQKLRDQHVDIVTFFSARTGQAFFDLVHHEDCTSALYAIKALCLSDLVVNSVKDLRWQSVHVAETPDRDAMAAALRIM